MKLHFCAEQLGIQSHQLSVSVVEVGLVTTDKEDEEEMSKNIYVSLDFFKNCLNCA